MNVDVPCICPPVDGQVRHPNGDVVTMRDKMPFRDALAMRYEVQMAQEEDPGITGADMLAVLSEAYVIHGITQWTLERTNGKGKVEPIPVSRVEVATFILDNLEVALKLSDVGDDLYAAAVMLPLIQAGSTSSPGSPTASTTSVTKPRSAPRPKRSKRSSITTIPTDVTVTTSESPDGDSSSSPKSVSAA